MEDGEFLALSQLFDSIGVIEKGIEKIYHYLLLNKRIDDLKVVCHQYNLTLKRGYKICSVLNELELVQIYDRPMKIHLVGNTISVWQKIINQHIEELTNELQTKKLKAESSFNDFAKTYKLSEEIVQEPVEFINYNLLNFDESYHQFLAESQSKIAIGIRYENPFVLAIKEKGISMLAADIKDQLKNGMDRIIENLKRINVKVIFNSDLIVQLLDLQEFILISEYLNNFEINFRELDVRVTNEDFSNFALTDDELIQPSFDPTNKLIGSYISRNKNIYQIFNDKFNELFDNSVEVNNFLQNSSIEAVKQISESQSFVLCLL